MSAASKLGVKRNTDRQMITIKTERDGQINIIPDTFGNGGTLVEFKNVQYLTDTQQLRGGMGNWQTSYFGSKYEYKGI
ncbi:putative toxin [Acinetobacter sp. V102_4]|nr:putative toxin [Acinetobacter sp. V102_4]